MYIHLTSETFNIHNGLNRRRKNKSIESRQVTLENQLGVLNKEPPLISSKYPNKILNSGTQQNTLEALGIEARFTGNIGSDDDTQISPRICWLTVKLY